MKKLTAAKFGRELGKQVYVRALLDDGMPGGPRRVEVRVCAPNPSGSDVVEVVCKTTEFGVGEPEVETGVHVRTLPAEEVLQSWIKRFRGMDVNDPSDAPTPWLDTAPVVAVRYLDGLYLTPVPGETWWWLQHYGRFHTRLAYAIRAAEDERGSEGDQRPDLIQLYRRFGAFVKKVNDLLYRATSSPREYL